MSLTPDPEPAETPTIQVSLEIFPENGPVELRPIAVGLQPMIILGVEDGTFTITLSACNPGEALDVLRLATRSLHNHLGTEGN